MARLVGDPAGTERATEEQVATWIVLPLQVCSNFGKLGERGLEVFVDFLR
jgi:hypothetical protein